MGKEITQKGFGTRFEQELSGGGRQFLFAQFLREFEPPDFANGEQFNRHSLLGQGIDKTRRDHLDFVHLLLQEEVTGAGGDRLGLGIAR